MGDNKLSDESGVRTHASEDMAALTPRLRPLGHLTSTKSLSLIKDIEKSLLGESVLLLHLITM